MADGGNGTMDTSNGGGGDGARGGDGDDGGDGGNGGSSALPAGGSRPHNGRRRGRPVGGSDQTCETIRGRKEQEEVRGRGEGWR